MLDGIQILAPAKVNIGLNVYPKREDGFHNIESIFQTVKLYDKLTVFPIPEKNVCKVDCLELELPEENTLTLTYKAFCAFTGCDFGVKVTLEKHIPSGAGLGGGSSDAAYFLKALAKLNGIFLDENLADKVASKVGSDVFFFLHAEENQHKNACAIVTGRGEFVKKIDSRNELYFLLVFPEVCVSTKDAYGLLDNSYCEGNFTSCPKLTELEDIYRRPLKDWTFANSFTSVLLQKYPVIGDALGDVKKSGAVWADMSGSGATVFGVFDDRKNALEAFTLLKKRWTHCVLA
ncbi:4-(cytidine 5'-diphospho)-2-C-methyl-D-erythritol kinase [Treponema pectinovorum]|uniref:4-(cytidine 5'-diphospho)-2-C-methyl-D-erythritol kinase n=1 Tax=Treponema pectinovorum TaxID=164 RepID=UPI003D9124FC